MTGMKHSIVIVALSSFLLCGCDQSHEQLSGGYYLERFDEGGTSYYVGAPGQAVEGGGVFDGTVQEIGWNKDWILARVNKLFHGDTNGWYALELKTSKIVGPLSEIDIKTNSAFSGIKLMPVDQAFSGHL